MANDNLPSEFNFKGGIKMDRLFAESMVKFDTLNRITAPTIRMNVKTINLFINFDNLFQSMKNPRSNRVFQCCGPASPKQLVSNVINMIAHYRQWAVRRGLKVTVYGFWTSEKFGFENSIFVKDYRQYYRQKCSLANNDVYYINRAITDGMPLASTILDHINGVYLLDSHFTEPSIIPYFIQKEVSPADWNFIISKDEYDFQYAAIERFTVIRPKKTFDNKIATDESVAINFDNLWQYIHSVSESCTNLGKVQQFAPSLYPLCLAVVGDKRRSIPRVTQFSWRKIVGALVEIGDKCDHDFSSETLVSAFLETFSKSNVSLGRLNENLKAISLTTGYNNMSLASKQNIKSQLIDKGDYENLKELNLNPDYFVNYPLNLQFLTDERRN